MHRPDHVSDTPAAAREPTHDEAWRLLRAELRRRLATQVKWRGLPGLIDSLHDVRHGLPAVARHEPHAAAR